jgi:hypothetical protein
MGLKMREGNVEDIDLLSVKRQDISDDAVSFFNEEDDTVFKRGMYTLKINGQFRKKLVDDGAMASFYDCYDGKKAGLICVFDVGDTEALAKGVKAKPGEKVGVQIEIPLNKIEESILNGERFIQELLGLKVSAPGFSELDEDEFDDEDDEDVEDFGAFG